MAYAAVTSLKSTIKRLLNSSRVSIVSPSQEIIEFAYEDVESLQQVLERWDDCRNSSEGVKALDAQIREAACKLEDVLEFHVSDQILAQSESHLKIFSIDLEDIKQDIRSLIQRVKKMEVDYINELDNPLPEEEDDDAMSSRRIDFFDKTSKMVGLSDHFRQIKGELLQNSHIFRPIVLAGMAGIGKTTLTKEISQDPLIMKKFECCVFVSMGQKSQLKKIMQAFLAQVNPDSDQMCKEGYENLCDYFCKSLNGRRYLIVLDDVWNVDFWGDFRKIFQDEDNRSQFLVTTRLCEVVDSIMHHSRCYVKLLPFMDKEESWDLLREKVFAEKVCPSELEKAGKKIAENCEGLPLLIITIADLLRKVEKTPEYWNEVAANKENSIFMDAYDQLLEVLHPSYNYLPQHLKACFHYMGAFPQDYDVPSSRLVNLWIAEGFLEPNPFGDLEHIATMCFQELVSSNIVAAHQRTRKSLLVDSCSLHSVYRHLCKKEVVNQKFLHILNSYADGLAKDIDCQRRLSIYKSILFSIKDVYNSMASISTLRSLLCTGPYHQYQVPIYFDLRLLRVLDALAIRFYEFPMEVLKLVQLRYLALTYNGNIPSSISKLWNLQYLIVFQHLSIKSTVVDSYLPVEIWDLQELEYLHIMGRNLPDPCGAVLPNLLTLLDVGVDSCTKGVLEGIPYLNKLRIQIELEPDAAEPLSCFDLVSHLRRLISLQCVVVNPKLRPEVVPPPPPLSILPFYLIKLTLSGLGYPWKDMSTIAELPYLRELKLQCCAFQGEKWEVREKGFLSLWLLVIEDSDLVHWKVGDGTFRILQVLSMKNCYKLQEIPYISTLKKIQLVDCNPSALTCAQQIKEASFTEIPYGAILDVHSSWDHGNLKSWEPEVMAMLKLG